MVESLALSPPSNKVPGLALKLLLRVNGVCVSPTTSFGTEQVRQWLDGEVQLELILIVSQLI